PVNATEKILAVKKTWGRRCTKLLILSSANNTETDTNNNQSQGYMSGGAGYVLSKESLIRFAEISVKNPDLCFQDHTGPEDLMMGKCLEKVGVVAMDTRDASQHHRFLPFTPDLHLSMKTGDIAWYWIMTYYPQNLGME
ncbi:unnamed protein product, partial [Allacma fusca]